MVKSILNLIISIAVATATTIIAIDAISTMLFGSLGKTTESVTWNYILTLYSVLAAIAPLTVITQIKLKYRPIANFAKHLTAILSGALLGFYYGGINSNNDPKIALISALCFSAIAVILNNKNKLATIAIFSINTVATYGFALLTGVMAITLLSAEQFISGILCAFVSLVYICLTVFHGNLNIKQITSN